MKKNKNTSRFQSSPIQINAGLNDDYKKIISFFIVLLVITVAILLLYFLNGQYVTKDFKDKETTTTTVKFDASIITVADLFKQGKGEYMVLLYDTSDKVQNVLYSSLVGNYAKEKVKLYSIDLGSALNKKYYNKDAQENKSPKTAAEVVITKPTLITINKGKVTSFLTDKDKIVEKLTK